jgi:hypothetical protein
MKTALRLLGLAALASSAVGALAAFNPASKPARVATTSKAATLVEKKQEAKVPALAPEPTKLQAKVPPGPPPPAPLEGEPQRDLRGGIYPTRMAAAKPPGDAGIVRQIPLINGVDPKPASPPSTAIPAQAPAAPSATSAITSAKAPTECLPPGLRAVLQEVQARFGPVTLVSTTALHTDNHSHGSTRHKMHTHCRAVDFKVQGDVQAVLAFLKSRPEVGGINSYRNNGVIHIDQNSRPVVAGKRP